jgi:aryl-alcohol dehydrogenase-like predicted oxidoreductase
MKVWDVPDYTHGMSQLPTTADQVTNTNTLARRHLGRTGLQITALALGGVKYNQLPDDQAAAVVNRAIDLGINYIDTAYAYKDSEQKIGPVLAERRDEVIIATKTLKRDYDGAMAEFKESCQRLQTDHVDIWQMHDLADEQQLNTLLSKDGALRAAEELRQAGRIDFIGVTGHRDPDLLAKALHAYPFDTILVSVGPIHEAVRPFHQTILPVARQRGVGILGMKVFAAGWMEQMPELSIRFVMGLDGVTSAVVGVDNLEQLEANVAVARRFKPLTDAESEQLLTEARSQYEAKPDKAWFIHK